MRQITVINSQVTLHKSGQAVTSGYAFPTYQVQ